MSTNFHWQTEDDSVWNDLAEPGRPYEPGQRSWITVVVLLIVLSVGGWIIGRQVQQRVETATADAEAEILASHNLVRMAAAHGDAELFRTVLSGRSKNWMASHSKLVEAKLLFDRSAFGLTPLAQAEPLSLTDVNIELSPELQAAELRQVWPYAINRGQGVTETVQLEHITVYRRGATRWLLSPPEPEFWGTWRTLQGERVSLTYPARDEAIVRRLAPDLDNLLNDVCHRLNDAACPADLYLQLRLETDPASLLETAGLLAVAGGGYRLELPAPSLVGLPLDERGYQALLRGYGAYVAAAAITRLVDYDCCRDNIAQGLFYRALLDKQLSQLGLRPWPLTPAEYEQLLTRAAGQTFLAQDWLQRSLAPATATNWREVYSIV
ncbi:MAG TPA: hypothetical protein VF177_11785, partial [Anaerolineae bacterium]